MGKDKIKSATLSILFGLAELVDEFLEPISYQTLKRRAFGPMPYDSKHYTNNLHSLERRGLIKLNRQNCSVELTNKGQIKVIENSSDKSRDGRWRMISYDIPETHAKKRIQFCRSIRRIGFRQVQKSLWACPFIKADEINLIINELGIQKYVAYLLVEKTDIEDHLKHLFKD